MTVVLTTAPRLQTTAAVSSYFIGLKDCLIFLLPVRFASHLMPVLSYLTDLIPEIAGLSYRVTSQKSLRNVCNGTKEYTPSHPRSLFYLEDGSIRFLLIVCSDLQEYTRSPKYFLP
jgi:hypothetical protein